MSTKSERDTRPRARAIRKSDPEYAVLMEKQAAAKAAERAAVEALEAEMAEAVEVVKAEVLPKPLMALQKAMQDHGPVVTLAMFVKLFPQFDISVSI